MRNPILILSLAAALAGCGVKGDPQAPGTAQTTQTTPAPADGQATPAPGNGHTTQAQ